MAGVPRPQETNLAVCCLGRFSLLVRFFVAASQPNGQCAQWPAIGGHTHVFVMPALPGPTWPMVGTNGESISP